MKIVLAYSYYGEGLRFLGGVERVMFNLSRRFRDRGHDCSLFFFGPRREPSADADCCFGDLADLMRLCHTRRVQTVVANVTDWDTGIAAVRRMPERPRLLVVHHGVHHPAWTSRNCDGIIACSQWGSEDQQRFTDLPVQVVPNGVDTAEFADSPSEKVGPPIVGWVGRAGDLEQKRFDLFAAAAPLLAGAGLRLRIADPDAGRTVPASIASALSPIVESWESVDRASMPAFYRTIAASGGGVLSTSRYEGLSMAMLEALACGCPLIGPDVVGVNECILPDYGGILFDADSAPEQIAATVIETVADREKMAWRREQARRLVQNRFSLDVMAEEYLRLCRAAPSAKRRRPARPFAALPASSMVSRRFWAAANAQYQAANLLSTSGEYRLSRAAMAGALATCPSLFLRPRRLARLVRTWVARPAPAFPAAGPASVRKAADP